MAAERKQEIITFKVDRHLSEAMQGIPNRSHFIRSAILAALEGTCPLCRGTGILTPEQMSHWQKFAKTHDVRKCQGCQATYLYCSEHDGAPPDVHEPENCTE